MSNVSQQERQVIQPTSPWEVSVIIPAYNAAGTLAETLESLLAQTHGGWEAIIVDDGSTDRTAEVANRYTAEDRRMRLVRRANGGESAARNTGIAEARYEWLLFLDADDWIAPTHLERLTGELAADPRLDAVHCGYARVTKDGTRMPEKYTPPSGDLFRTLARRAAFPVHTCIVRRSLVALVGSFDTSLKKSPDWDLWQRIARTGAQFGTVREVLAYYRMQPNSASLDARQLLRDGLRVLAQGHAPDPRVRNPHPSHAQGLPREQMPEQQYYLLSWCAGLMIGRGEDPRSLLDLIDNRSPRALYPDAIAQCVFDAAPLATCQSAHAWDELWPKLENLIDEFFTALEAHAKTGELAACASLRFKQLLLANSPVWGAVMDDVQRHRAVLTEDRDNWRRLAEQHAETLASANETIERLEHGHKSLQDERDQWQTLAAQHQSTVEVLTAAVQHGEHDKRLVEAERDNWLQLANDRQNAMQALTAAQEQLEHDKQLAEQERETWLRLANERQTALEGLTAAVQQLEHDKRLVEGERENWLQQANERQNAIHALSASREQLEHEKQLVEQERENWLRLANERQTAIHVLSASSEQLEHDKQLVEQEREHWLRLAGEREQATAHLQQQLGSLTAERNALQFSPERQMGELLLNRLHLKRPVLAMAAGARVVGHRLGTARLTAERSLSPRRNRPRVLATVCSNFPIYSQTFVYQELNQLIRQGFNVRLIYSKLDPRRNLSTQFSQLWPLKRRLQLNRGVHERDFASYQERMPEKVQALVEKLCQASGLSREALLRHDNFLQAFSFTRLAEAYRPHYIHSYFFYDRSLMALVASWLLDIPRGISCYADHVLKDYELKVVPLHLELCNIVIATSQRIKQELLAMAPQADAEKILVKPNGIDTECFPVIERAEPGPDAPFRIVSVCRIEPKKGLLDLVEAVQLLRQRGVRVEAHLVGAADDWSEASRNYKQKFDQRITELNLWGTVHLEGQQNHDGILRFLGLAQLFVAPFVETETGDKDGIPTAVLEGMATGLPVVATNAGSIPEVIVDGQDGVLTAQRDPVALATAIETLLRDPDQRQRLGQNGADRVRASFDVRNCETAFHERLQAILKSRPISQPHSANNSK